MMSNNPLIVQDDFSILAEISSPGYIKVRDDLNKFAELLKSPQYIHTYKLTPLSIWNARSIGLSTSKIINTLKDFSKYPISDEIVKAIKDLANRYGKIKIYRSKDNNQLELLCDDIFLAKELLSQKEINTLLKPAFDDKKLFIDLKTNIIDSKSNLPLSNPSFDKVADVRTNIKYEKAANISKTFLEGKNEFIFSFNPIYRGKVKQILINMGYPTEDLAGYIDGEKFDISLRTKSLSSELFELRDYQIKAVNQFHREGSNEGGSGVLVLPCGAGKTIIGIAVAAKLSCHTLILTTGITSVKQWIKEIKDKTNVDPIQVSEYSGQNKQISPITIATYNILSYRNNDNEFIHMSLFNSQNWGLIIYDEVHLLPAPIFQMTASLQSKRRLGLTATLIREDGREKDVFSLIGPKKGEISWKELEKESWIAKAKCIEIHIPLHENFKLDYAIANKRNKFRIACENPLKLSIVEQLILKHKEDSILIFGMYLEQLKFISKKLDINMLSGSILPNKRDKIFDKFRNKEIKILAVSKIANFAIDLPDASIAIQISGTFGSRQEEAQRLGRIIRPKKNNNNATFYSIVSKETVEQDFARNRQLFLIEQGYEYQIQDHNIENIL